ncbi:uncharacterized protein F5Z01DRAFT_636726 [Emericellopsis atlantica]|uniref:DUF427 domain-containing protein n=1 Tax=Emericellopsis atlantica TaxID=2614577 RepID=A0A9P7ZL15_9HYPO|nr:uncharacterized protein F5Z01DRAFT_636726 [Emericellopsis atlantica]KAG9254064.1 hypothetical protein F5Z01DRAFT_636726 [Emericellopsis atlantica]
MSSKPTMNVQSFPRPPKLEKISRHVRVVWEGQDIAETNEAFWVLETHHPPSRYLRENPVHLLTNETAYYLPPSAMKIPLTKLNRKTYCEWKGMATYYSVTSPSSGTTVSNRIWSYDNPTNGFESIKGYLSLYAGPWDCFVDGEKVQAQPGDFYGGWVTSEIQGIVKGKNGNWDPVL